MIASTTYGQLRLDSSMTAEELVQTVLLKEGSGIIVSNVKFTGLKQSMASFINESPEELIDAGLILSTGDVFDAIGPNKAKNTGTRGSARTDQDLQAIATGVVTDAVVLEFDLIALRDSIVFTYVFASEEYPEYVDKGVNDVFGFFIYEIGGNYIRPLNIARLPVSRKKVTIDNVNHRRNDAYFLKSDFLDAHTDEFWRDHKSMMMRARIFEYDGFTIPLQAVARLKEGKKYHLKIALADVGDRNYDSAVLIRANSFSSKGEKVESADSIVLAEVKSKMNDVSSISFNDNLSFSLLLNFDVDDSQILAESIIPLKKLSELMGNFKDIKLQIIGHTDSDGTTQSNLELSKRRADTVYSYLIKSGVKKERLSTLAKGEEEAAYSNDTEEGKAQNRRVEFVISY